MIEDYDKQEKQFGATMIILTFVFFLILVAKPFSMKGNLLLLTLGTLAAFIPALIFVFRAIKLYGPNSAEGKVWTKIFLMMVVLAIGVGVSDSADTTHPFAYFVIIAFSFVIWAIYGKIKGSGMKPSKFDMGVAFTSTTILGASLFFYMSAVVSMSPEPFLFGEYYAEMIALFICFVVLFMARIMTSLMGGYISKGWNFIAAAAGLFAVFYALIVPLRFVGWYEEYYYMELLSVLALNAATFSAYYQRREHLKLISF